MPDSERATLQEAGCQADNASQAPLHTLAREGLSIGQFVSPTPPRTEGHDGLEDGHAPGAADCFGGRSPQDHAAKGGIHAAGTGEAPRHPIGRLIRSTSCPHSPPSRPAGSRSIRVARPSGSGRSRQAFFPVTPMPSGWRGSIPKIRSHWKSRPTLGARSPARVASAEQAILAISSLRSRLTARHRESRWMTCGG